MCKIYSKELYGVFDEKKNKEKHKKIEKMLQKVVKNVNYNTTTGTAFIKP